MKKCSFNSTVVKLFFIFWFSAPSAYSQFSYEFGNPLPIEAAALITTDPVHFGHYEGDNAQLKYEVNEQGIFIHTLNIQAISHETIRETGKYSVRNEHIFGVTEDSIPYVFQDDNYYFGVRNTLKIAGDTSENKLTPNGAGSYIINFKTDNGYTPALFEFRNNQLNISYFDYDSEGKMFRKIKEKQIIRSGENSLTTIVLLPTLREWQKISGKELFGEVQVFQKK